MHILDYLPLQIHTKNPTFCFAVTIYPYDEVIKREEEKDLLFQQRFQEVYKKGETTFEQYLQKNKLQSSRTEEEAYDIIKNA